MWWHGATDVAAGELKEPSALDDARQGFANADAEFGSVVFALLLE